MGIVNVLRGGFFTTAQDFGRIGYQKFGMPVAGVMDDFAYRVSNYLVGNREGEAVLEATLLGPELEFRDDMVIAMTGASMDPTLNGRRIPMWESVKVKSGDKLSLAGVTKGLRSYIAFAGELDIDPLNNSKATYTKSGFGGFKGRRMLDGDELQVRTSNDAVAKRHLSPELIPDYPKRAKVRVVLGPQDDHFTAAGISAFLGPEGYKITPQADRMGYRLQGPIIEHKKGADIISDGTVFGSIQVPANGKPIVLMADRQTTGGYTKIATVISSDLPKLSQMGSGDEIVFEAVSLEEAHSAYLAYEKNLDEIRLQVSSSQDPRWPVPGAAAASADEDVDGYSLDRGDYVGPQREIRVILNGVTYLVELRELRVTQGEKR